MASAKIIGLSILAAVIYGILQDQITARICVEYFTIGHPPIFRTNSPTLLGFGWGIVATWWFGLILGTPLAMVSRLGLRPQLSPSQLVRPIICLMVAAGILAAIAGIVGYVLARQGLLMILEPLASQIPAEKHVPFLADAAAHLAAYAAGGLGAIVVCVWAWRKRGKLIPVV